MQLSLATSPRDLSIQILDGATAKEVRTFKNVRNAGFAFSSDGRLVAGSTQADHTGKIWEIASGKELQTLPAHISVQTFSPDSRLLVWTNPSDSTLVLWDIAAQSALRTITTPGATFWGTVASSPDARWLTSAGNDKRLVLWDAGTGKTLRVFDPKETVLSASSSSDSRMWLTRYPASWARMSFGHGMLSQRRNSPCVPSRNHSPGSRSCATVAFWRSCRSVLRAISTCLFLAFGPNRRGHPSHQHLHTSHPIDRVACSLSHPARSSRVRTPMTGNGDSLSTHPCIELPF